MPSLEPVLQAGQDLIDVVEIEPEPYWTKSAQTAGQSSYQLNLDTLHHFSSLPYHLLLHGVGFPIGGTAALDDAHTQTFNHTIELLKPAWVSEHLSFNRVQANNQRFETGFLLPPIQTDKSISVAVNNIEDLKEQLSAPFAFETGVNYLKPQAGELSDGLFWRSIAEKANCGILLDLHNLWCNQVNGRQKIMDVIDELPLERIWEIHLAGGQELDGYWLDAHSDMVPPELMELAAEIIPRLPNLKAINYELMEEYYTANKISVDSVLNQMQDIKALWETRGTRVVEQASQPTPCLMSAHHLPKPEQWEFLLGSATAGTQSDVAWFNQTMSEDAGIQIFRKLTESVRAGMVVDGLKYSSRLLLLCMGEDSLKALLEGFWKTQKPYMFPNQECQAFADYIKTLSLTIPHLEALLSYDLAVLAIKAGQATAEVVFETNPAELLGHLDAWRIPVQTEEKASHRITLKAS